MSWDEPASPFERPTLPGVPAPSSPGVKAFTDTLGRAANPGVTAPLVPPAKSDDRAKPPPTQAERLNDLFQRLAAAGDAAEADGVALIIEHIWLESGSDTADLLMSRCVQAFKAGKTDLAAQLLDKIVVLDPTWAEAWNRRATLRFLKGDDVGAMEDIAQVLAIEPRHFGALSGMSFIFEHDGMDKQALALARKAAAIYPHNSELEKLKTDLSLKVEGRDI